MNEKEFQGIEKLFREAVQTLALSSSEQIRVTIPGCVTCEISEDFILYYESFLECFNEILTVSQKQKIQAISKTLEAIPEDCFDCNDEAAIEHESWNEVRRVSAAALDELGWEFKSPEEYTEVEQGVWKREK